MRWNGRILRLTLLAVAAAMLTACGHGSGSGIANGPRTGVLVAIGASDAVGIGAVDPGRENWVAQLAARFPTGTRVVNLGIGGADAARAAEQELPVALDTHPSVVVVWLGVNDFAASVPLPDFSANLQTILGALHESRGTHVYVGNLPDLRLLPAFRGHEPSALDRDVTTWNGAIERVSSASGATVVDIHGGWSELHDHPEYVSRDGLHPSAAGYRRIADLFWRAMQATGNRQPATESATSVACCPLPVAQSG